MKVKPGNTIEIGKGSEGGKDVKIERKEGRKEGMLEGNENGEKKGRGERSQV